MNVQDFIAVGRTRRNLHKPSWLITNIIVAFVLLVVKEAISSTYREAEISSESKIWNNVMMEEMNSFHKNDTEELTKVPQEKVIGYKWVFAKK